MMIYTIGTGFIYANAYAGAFTPYKNLAGVASSLYGLLQIGWSALISLLIAALPGKSLLSMSLVLISLALTSFLILYVLILRNWRAEV